MKIAYCLAGTFNSGGMERIVVGKANWLAAHGYEVSIVTTEQAGRPDFFPLNEKITRVDLDIMYSETLQLSPISKFFERTRRMKLHRQKLAAFLFDFRPDITISTFGNEVMFLPKIKDGSKKIAEIHFSRWFRLQANRRGVWKWIDKVLTWQDKKALSRYDKFIGLTQEDLKNWTKVHNVEVIPNFITELAPVPAPLAEKSMIAVGRLAYQKGYERLLAAWNIVYMRFPDWKLHIYGSGELQSVLQHEINTRHLESVITIHKPESDITSRYLESSALVLSSRYEGLPMVLLEAGACGLPLISYTCPCGPRDLIKDGYNGWLVPEGNVEALADAIIKVMEDKELRVKMGRNALEESKKYLQNDVMPRWVDLFQRVTGS